MQYSNLQPPEGINTSREHPLKEFIVLTAGLIGLMVIVVVLVAFFTDHLAKWVPFEVELRLAAPYVDTVNADSENLNPAIEQYLQSLADRLTAVADLPEGMSITVHYANADVVNAFATLGGNLVFFRGLLQRMPHENALAMVMAHEIAHIKHRHPLASLGRGVIISVVFSLFGGDGSVDAVMGNTGLLTLLKFSRDMESEADEDALHMVNALYGHVSGAADLFKVLHEARDVNEMPQFISSHPLDQNRLTQLAERATARGWSVTGQQQPLPTAFSHWLQVETVVE